MAKGQPQSGPTNKAELGKLGKKERNQDSKPKGTHGGARPGGGRKKLEDKKEVQTFMGFMAQHAEKEVTVVISGPNGQKIEKTAPRIEIMADVLFEMAVKDRNVRAAEIYQSRAYGKPIQPLHHTGTMGINQEVPREDDKAIAAAISAYENNAG